MTALESVGVLLRVSSDDQKHDSQRDVVSEWLRNKEVDPETCEWYVETETGRKIARKELDRLGRDIHAGRIKTVLVYKIDRISRTMLDGIQLVIGWANKGIRVISATEPLDLSGTMGQMVATLLFGLAEIEWKNRRERQRDGIASAKRKGGVYKGRKAGTTKAKPERIRELRVQGLQAPEIAQALGVSVRTVFRHLEPVTPNR
jgi:DNA invertase Pin-like site-specific DNA recombinase